MLLASNAIARNCFAPFAPAHKISLRRPANNQRLLQQQEITRYGSCAHQHGEHRDRDPSRSLNSIYSQQTREKTAKLSPRQVSLDASPS